MNHANSLIQANRIDKAATEQNLYGTGGKIPPQKILVKDFIRLSRDSGVAYLLSFLFQNNSKNPPCMSIHWLVSVPESKGGIIPLLARYL